MLAFTVPVMLTVLHEALTAQQKKMIPINQKD